MNATTSLQTPSISIVIPAFNHAHFIGDTLRSVQSQSFANWECVVVDDGSSDDTFAISRAFATEDHRIRAVRTKNQGESEARNHGYRLTNSEARFVTFMDGDDIWLPHALMALLSRIDADPQAIGAHGLAEMVDESGNLIATSSHSNHGRSRLGLEGKRLVPWPLDRPTSFEVLINGNVLFPPGLVLARRSAYERAGKFDDYVGGATDWDMLIRLTRGGYLSFIDDVILHYRRHGANAGAVEGIREQSWSVRCKGFHSPENNASQRRIARLGWRSYQRQIATQRYRSSCCQLRAGNPALALDSIVRAIVHLVRALRGYPTPRIVRASERWDTTLTNG